jgi:raffinose/stachyose/melibiose transport system substrate-binding protein
MLKRIISLLVVVLLVVSVFAACGTAKTPTDTATSNATTALAADTTKAATPVVPQTINLITPWTIPQETLDAFKAKTGNEVKVSLVPNSTEDYLQARNAQMSSGADLDIIGADGADVADFAHKGTFVELTNESWMQNITSDSLKLISDYSSTPDKQFTVVYEAMTFGIWYNKDIFKKYDIQIPTNYEDFVAVCDTLKKNGVTPLVQGGKDVWPFDQELNMLMEPMYNKHPNFWPDMYAGKIKFTDPDFKQEAKKLEILYPSKGYYLQGALSTAYDQAWQLILQKKAAMWFMGSWANDAMSKSDVKPDFEVGVFAPPLNYKADPQFSPKLLTRHYGVLSSSKKIDVAKEFLGFLTQADIATIYVEKGATISTVKDVSSSALVAGADWAKIFALPMGGQNNKVGIGADGKLYID